MTVFKEPVAMTVEASLTGTAERPLGVAPILRMFDLLRLRVARNVGGSKGFTTGYDVLQIDRAALADRDSDTIRVVAAVTGHRPHAHLVEYRAWAPAGPTADETPLVLARGWTQIPPKARGKRA